MKSVVRIDIQKDGDVLLIGLDRADKRNAFDIAMFHELCLAYGELDRNSSLRVGVLHAHGDHFTAGMDLPTMRSRLVAGEPLLPDGGVNPWGTDNNVVSKPVVAAVHGTCLTLGIELLLAADVRIASDDATFGQIEVARGITPFGGSTTRFPQVAGWGNAMRWILTAENFDAAEALRLGVVQEIVDRGRQLDRAVEIAHRIAAQAPLGVQAALRLARLAQREGPVAADAQLVATVTDLFGTEDAHRGFEAFLSRRPADFVGH